MTTRIGLGRVPLRCLKCGNDQFDPVGREFDTPERPDGYPALEFIECECGAGYKLATLVDGQAWAPLRPTSAVTVRVTDPEPSHINAQLDFTSRRQQVLDALEALGRADTAQIAAWINRQGHKPTDKASVARRLTDLAAIDPSPVAKAGTGDNADGNTATIWRLTTNRRTQ